MQGTFKHGNLPKLLLQAREILMLEFRPLLKEAGISEQQWRVLRVLYEFGPIDAVTLAEQAQVLAPSLSRMLRMLEKMDLVDRSVNDEDLRRQNIELSKKGAQFVLSLGKEIELIYQTLEEHLGADLLEDVYQSVERLITSLQAR